MGFGVSNQLTFADCEFNGKRCKTRKDIFLARMAVLLQWPRILGVIEPIYPKVGNGRCPYLLDTKIRIYCIQQWYNLSDGAMEDALYEVASIDASVCQTIPGPSHPWPHHHHELSSSAGVAPTGSRAL